MAMDRSIWVAWFTREILEGSISNFWTLKEKTSHSWVVKRLLRLRNLIYPCIKLIIGNVRSCRFWSDHWSPFGSISEFLNLQNSSRLGIRRDATIADLNCNGNWSLPPARSDQQVMLYAYISNLILTDLEDTYVWMVADQRTPASLQVGYIERLNITIAGSLGTR